MQSTESESGNDSQPIQENIENGEITLAVMPFTSLEMSISRLAFTDSLGRQLCGELGRFDYFSVISYYTSQQLNSKHKEIHSLASNFGAQYVITGNVQFEARELRVDIQLTDAHSGIQIWTELYQFAYKPGDFFEVADKIVSRVMASLGDFNGVIAQQISKDQTVKKSDAFRFTLLSSYYDFYYNFSVDGYKKAFTDIENAVERYPTNALAWAFLGEISLLSFLFNHLENEDPVMQAFHCAQTALKLNPRCQHGYITLGMAHIFADNRSASLEALEQARELNPSASGLMGVIGCLLICAGEYSRGMEMIKKSIELNKSFPAFFHLSIAFYHFKRKEYVIALQEADKMDLPNFILGILFRISTLSHLGRSREANTLAKTLKKLSLHNDWIAKDYFRKFLLDPEMADRLFKGLKPVQMPLLIVA